MKNKGTYKDKESIVSARLLVDMDALQTIMENTARVEHDVMQGIGFTTKAVAGLMNCAYNKICNRNSASIYSYDGYETAEGLVMLFVMQGGAGYRLAWNKELNTWLITQIASSYSLRNTSGEEA